MILKMFTPKYTQKLQSCQVSQQWADDIFLTYIS